jgi:tRNA(Ile)-lysidine synthase
VASLRVAVASSGGLDSTALLHCTLRQAQALGIEVLALHVHHGLMPQADAWLAQVRTQTRRWGAGFDARRLQGQPVPGESVEAWARAGRYRALAEMAQAADCALVLLAHHRRDQAETWFLQALRGAGPAGLAAMPTSSMRAGITWARPWLDQPREAIEAYVRRHRLLYVQDSSNADPRFARSRLRLQVWPVLQAAFADAESTLATAARRAQEALALAREAAALDLPQVAPADALDLAPWLALPRARRLNVLRAWLDKGLPGGVPETLVARLMAELPATSSARWPAGQMQLALHKGLLRVHVPPVSPPTAGPMPCPGPALDLSHPGTTPLPGWGGCMVVSATQQGGAAPGDLRGLTAANRQGGEAFQLAPHATARSLKKQFQALGVPAWQRQGPLLYTADGRLLYVPGLGVCGRLQAPPGELQLRLDWLPDSAPAAPEAPAAGLPRATARRQRAG